MKFDTLNKWTGWLIFTLVFIVYALTAQRTIGFWDSPEFVASTYKLQVSHSPGAPLYTLLSRVFILFLPVSLVAYGCSLFSALAGAFTVFFLYKIIIRLGTQLLKGSKNFLENYQEVIVLGGASVGALCLAFSHTFWISSTEVEVYTVATLFIAVIFYLALVWQETESPRTLLLIAFLLGLSLGVHFISLALIFPIVFIYFLKKYPLNIKYLFFSFLASFLLYFFMNNFLFLGLLSLAEGFELIFVNSWKMPLHSGAIFSYSFVLIALCLGIYFSHKNKKSNTELILLGALVFIIGYSSYAMVIIRSNAQSPISNDGRDIFRLTSFIKYEQYLYEKKPLLKGQYFNSPLDRKQPYKFVKQKSYRWNAQKGQYETIGNIKKPVPNYAKEFNTFLPRMYNRSSINSQGYKDWVNIKGKPLQYSQNGKKVTIIKPTFFENLAFMFNYQLGWLNIRYLLWNFVGMQNWEWSNGGVINGNWATGINTLDRGQIGEIGNYSARHTGLKSHNVYYGLPFLLAVIGLVFLYFKNKKTALILAVLFFILGPAITIFNNSLPVEIVARDRDYILIGSFFAFAIWIGLGIIGLGSISKFINHKKRAIVLVTIGLMVPFMMAFKGWDDHDRSENNYPITFAKHYLDSCEPNSILITNGDNATFPLYYIQEVENYRTDVRVINFDLLSIEIYLDRLSVKINQAEALRSSINFNDGSTNLENTIPLVNIIGDNQYGLVSDVVDYVTSGKRKVFHRGKKVSSMPAGRFRLLADSNKFIQRGINPKDFGATFTSSIDWAFLKNYYFSNELILMDLLQQNNFEKPVYFAFTGNYSHRIGLKDYLVGRGLVEELMPIKPIKNQSVKKIDDVSFNYDFLMNKLNYDELNDSSIYIPSESRNISKTILRPLFYYLAIALVEKEEYQKANEVLDRCQEIMPNNTMPYNKYMFDLAKTYYKCNDQKEARQVIKNILDNLSEDISIACSFVPKRITITKNNAKSKMNIYSIIVSQLKGIDIEIHDKYKEQFEKHRIEYKKWATLQGYRMTNN